MTTSFDPRQGTASRPPRRHRTWPWVVASAVATVATAVVMTVALMTTLGPTISGIEDGGSDGGTVAAAPSAAPAAVPPAPRSTVPAVQGMSGESAVAALAAAGFTNIVFDQNGAPPSAPVVLQEPVAGSNVVHTTLIRLVAEPPPPVPHRALTAREWLLVAKSPDAHVGERITVHGHVTQFDAATGAEGFRANVDGVRHGRSYEYETNTVLRGKADGLRDVVQGDVFRADVTVAGTYSYQTTLGGTLTVPVLQIDAITVVG
jgi:hypothetical protein